MKQPHGRIYKSLTSVFALASVIYLWMTIDVYLDYKASLQSTDTVELFGSDWPVSTIHALVLSGWIMTSGPYATGMLVTQLGSMWWCRPRRAWLAAGIVVSLVCGFAAVTWASNAF